jgi:hypothetical protein
MVNDIHHSHEKKAPNQKIGLIERSFLMGIRNQKSKTHLFVGPENLGLFIQASSFMRESSMEIASPVS